MHHVFMLDIQTFLNWKSFDFFAFIVVSSLMKSRVIHQNIFFLNDKRIS
jgi:hypothetical protein